MTAIVGQDVWFFKDRGVTQKNARITYVLTDNMVNLMVEPDGPNPQEVTSVPRAPAPGSSIWFEDKPDQTMAQKQPPAVKPVAVKPVEAKPAPAKPSARIPPKVS